MLVRQFLVQIDIQWQSSENVPKFGGSCPPHVPIFSYVSWSRLIFSEYRSKIQFPARVLPILWQSEFISKFKYLNSSQLRSLQSLLSQLVDLNNLSRAVRTSVNSCFNCRTTTFMWLMQVLCNSDLNSQNLFFEVARNLLNTELFT